jgi:hypothetical protein
MTDTLRKTSNSEFPRWCPGCSRQVDELCHHLNCALKRSDETDRLRSVNEPRWLAELNRLRERCEAYKGQVETGAAEIDRLQRRIDLECDSYAKEAREAEMAKLRSENDGLKEWQRARLEGDDATNAKIENLQAENERMRKALELAEDVLSRSPYSTAIWPNGMHPNAGISQIRAALQGDQQ